MKNNESKCYQIVKESKALHTNITYLYQPQQDTPDYPTQTEAEYVAYLMEDWTRWYDREDFHE
jgi:hypothetical protein